MAAPVCWLFCTVIDNFGDIGVSWRLAQELHRRSGGKVWLWLDNEAALRAIIPDVPALPCRHRGIVLRRWQEGKTADLAGAPTPDILIETFACALPASVRDTIRRVRPLWLNWEYLSAENWALQSHAMPSLQADGSRKYFWQMGFSPESGGLLREAGYEQARQAFAADTAAQSRLRRRLGLPDKDSRRRECFAFGYRSAIWAQWFDSWRSLQQPISLWLAGSQIADSLREAGRIPADALLDAGSRHLSGCLELIRIPFVPQHEFDQVLWLADMLLVRGEDSFVRAQYAAKPFFWHIYPQDENAHLDKLAAFWRLPAALMPDSGFQAAFTALSQELNGGGALNDNTRTEYWRYLLQNFPAWQRSAERWQQQLLTQSDSITRLLQWHRQLQAPPR